MDPRLISNSLAFHGQPLQKIWEGERGCNEFVKLGITNPDFTVYTARQKTLTFQDRAKRLKLHQFIARKAPVLFNENLIDSNNLPKRRDITTNITGALAIIPPYESLINKNYDKTQHLRHALGAIQPGDIIYGQVISRSSNFAMVRIFCTGEPIIRYLVDVPIKAYLLSQNMVQFVDKKNNPKSLSTNDYVCCEVLDISVDADRMNLGMKGTLTIDAKAPLGIITADQLPEYYKRSIDNVDNTFGEILIESKAFLNPNYDELLFQELGLDYEPSFSNMSSLTGRYPQQEYASELRQIQASKWAFRSVADGIEHFKVGRHSEAFQCLNKALNIDPRNVEGLVARGALYANSGSFKKAVDDFETALKLNPYHANARKYMGETLVALARSYEEDNRIEDARKAYTDCLNIIPHHDEAKSSLEFLNSKITGQQQAKQLIDTNDFILPTLKLKKDSPGSLTKKESKKADKKKKKQKDKTKRRDNTSSSSNSSSDTADSSSSNSSSDSSSSDSSDSSTTKKKKKKKTNDKQQQQQNSNLIGRQKSLSPLSKRLALMDDPATGTTRYQFNKPFHLLNSGGHIGGVHMTGPPPPPPIQNVVNVVETDYDAKVRSFLEMTRDEDDYESSVRKLLENASKHKNERKASDEVASKSSKKKEKKKQKKMKKESKKEKKRKSKSDSLENMDLKEALKIFKSLPILGGNSESKLTAELEKYEKSIDDLKKQQIPSTSTTRLTPPTHFLDYPKPSLIPPSQVPPGSKLHFKIQETRKNRDPSPNPNGGSNQRNRPRTPAPIEQKPEIKPFQIRAPVVLDKFGCFRLATPQDDPNYQPPPVTVSKQRRSRSGSQRRRSRSRSRSPRQFRTFRGGRSPRSRSPMYDNNRNRFRSAGSRSPRRRYSRSPVRGFNNRGGGGNRRSRSRSRSPRRGRSRSPVMGGNRRFSPQRSPVGFQRRSRSTDFRRSRSFDRRRSGSPMRRSRSMSRSPPRRGRGRGGYRGSRYRGGRRGGGGYRGRGGFRGGGGPRSPFYRFGSRSRSISPSRSRSRSFADVDENLSRKRSDRDKKSTNNDGKWTHDKFDKNDNTDKSSNNEPSKVNDPSVEEIDKIINEAQKTRKEEIIQRDKDLLKKPTPTNLPF